MGKILDITGKVVGGEEARIHELEKELAYQKDENSKSVGDQFKKDLAKKLADDNASMIRENLNKIVEQEGTNNFSDLLRYLSFELNMLMGGFAPGYVMAFIITNPDDDNGTSILAASNHPDPALARDTTRTNEALLKAIKNQIAFNEAKKLNSVVE